MWDEIGMKPDTWDNLRIGGAKLKAKGHPVGLPLGHSNDPSTTWRGLLWCYGASIQDEAGKKIVLNSKQAVEATKYAAALYKEAMAGALIAAIPVAIAYNLFLDRFISGITGGAVK